MTLRENMRRHELDLVLEYLELAFGNMAEAGRLAGMTRHAFWRLVEKHNINPTVFVAERTA